jgi:uncharacterized protein
MSIQQTIRGQIKDAMIKKESVRLNVLRSLVTAFTNELVSKIRKPTDELSDDEALAVIRRAVKQHKDSIEQFKSGGRTDLVAAEEEELVILEAFLPKLMDKEEIMKIAIAKKAELGITDKSKIGQFIGSLMKDLKGQADGNDVKSVVESLFN